MSRRDELYISDISNARWIAYDLPGNLGWILYITGLILAFVNKPSFMDLPLMLQLMVVAAAPAFLMLVGIAELINERINKLDRVLSRACLLRGFGALTLGGILGAIAAVALLACSKAIGAQDLLYVWLMLIGGILCGMFAGLLFIRYKRK